MSLSSAPNSPTISRRTLLRRMALWAGVGALGVSGCRSADYDPLIAQLVELSADEAAARAIGEAFLEQSPSGRSRLAARLAEELEWNARVDSAELTSRLLSRIERDFRDGKTVQVQAWVLSQTEAWWAAVVALG